MKVKLYHNQRRLTESDGQKPEMKSLRKKVMGILWRCVTAQLLVMYLSEHNATKYYTHHFFRHLAEDTNYDTTQEQKKKMMDH